MALSLKSKTVFFATAVLTVFLLACQSNAGSKDAAAIEDSLKCQKPLPVRNPNGESELSTLMRKMQSNLETLRGQVERGEVPKEFPEEFKNIYTAKPTDNETKKLTFNVFADNYLENLRGLYSSEPKDLKYNYNVVVNSCASCHTEHCPGPLKAINKMKI